MSTIFVVEDSPTQSAQIKLLLEEAGFEVMQTGNGVQALQALARGVPDAIVTDLNMPEMDGLELVEQVRGKYPSVPVILMTAFGSEEIAIQALRKGAASYVPKRDLSRDLVNTLDGILLMARADRQQQRLLECLTETEAHFVIENDPALIPPLIGHLRESLARMKLCTENSVLRVTVALGEALNNAILHGNLEMSSALREGDTGAYEELARKRRQQKPYRDRRVHVVARESLTQAQYLIRDEGPGFDPATLPDPTDPANLERASGRGLLLIRTFMDQVGHSPSGNEITMLKRRDV